MSEMDTPVVPYHMRTKIEQQQIKDYSSRQYSSISFIKHMLINVLYICADKALNSDPPVLEKLHFPALARYNHFDHNRVAYMR